MTTDLIVTHVCWLTALVITTLWWREADKVVWEYVKKRDNLIECNREVIKANFEQITRLADNINILYKEKEALLTKSKNRRRKKK